MSRSAQKKLYTFDRCHCLSMGLRGDGRVGVHTHEHNGTSPLVQVRWRRLVVDLGESFTATRTAVFNHCIQISAQSRWAVVGSYTGTFKSSR